MLDAAHKADLVNGYRDTVDLLGTPFTHQHADGTGSSTVVAHFVDPKQEDAGLINSIGIEARIVHMNQTPIVNKYDVMISPSGREYSVYTVHELYVNDVLVGQKLYVKS